MSRAIHVVAAAIVDRDGRVLLTERPQGKHLAGYWEFPGGKIELNETSIEGLEREIFEEIGLHIDHCRPLIDVEHAYAEKTVRLEVWRVDRFHGDPHGKEGQRWAWVDVAQLGSWKLPPADVPIVNALQLPSTYCITPEPGDMTTFLAALERTLERGERLLQLRAKQLDPSRFATLAREFVARCHAVGARALLNCDPVLAQALGADGAHLSSALLNTFSDRPIAAPFWLGASCHDARELALAEKLGLDFAVLGPVAPTSSHPGRQPIGWSGFRELVRRVNIPVYALGGMSRTDVARAWDHGGQGVAGIRDFWMDR